MNEENTTGVSDIKLMPIVDLLDGSYSFFVPDYQRGYRWTSQQVVELLEDLLTFAISERSKDAYYCLQPVVVRRDEEKDRWEVIDGQQRLTTIKILLHWLEQKTDENDWAMLNVRPYSVEYATREATTGFIDSLSLKMVNETTREPIDFFFMRNAYWTIENWFSGKQDFTGKGAPFLCRRLSELPTKAREFIRDLLTSEPGLNPTARILWYEADPKESGTALFNRLNTGKLELTDSELVKGLFMLKTTDGVDADNEQFRMALKWERMENALHDDAFWSFLTPRPRKNEEKSAERKSYANRIDLLLELVFSESYAMTLAGQDYGETDGKVDVQQKKARDELDRKIDAEVKRNRAVFNSYNVRFNVQTGERRKEIELAWEEIESAFLVLSDWFSDPEIYNLVGYLCQTGTAKLWHLFHSFRHFVRCGKTRTDFLGFLRARIRDSLETVKVTRPSSEDGRTRIHLFYGDSHVFDLLLLLNIKHLNTRALADDLKSGEREILKFPFAVLADGWDIEHVDSRTANELRNPLDKITWIETAEKDLEFVLKPEQKEDIRRIRDSKAVDINDQLIRYLQGVVGEGEDDPDKDNISNLVLLDPVTNRSYKNSLFITKRRRIIECRETGQYVPETTSYVFFKLLEGNASTRWQWTMDDRQCYTDYIVCQLADYLTVSSEES